MSDYEPWNDRFTQRQALARPSMREIAINAWNSFSPAPKPASSPSR
jgi:hypothetical protein